MVARRNVSVMDGPGQDSFLDIVANLVGILIILVMVVGVRAKDAILEASPVADSPAESVSAEQVDHARGAANAVESDLLRINAKLRNQEFDIQYRRAERERVQLLVEAAERQLSERRSQLGKDEQRQFDVRRDVVTAAAELRELQSQVTSLETTDVSPAIIEHLPTPMAKTVFGQELHVRLQRGRVMVVPWDELVAKLQEKAPEAARRMGSRPQLSETLGPIGGFWMKYSLIKRQHAVPSRFGVAMQQGVELEYFVLVPVAEGLGESLHRALLNGSDFREALDAQRPDTTTVTVWTYPDSFNEFRILKKTLYERGYLLASRPLPEGHPIGGSPSGLRSAAQ